MMTRVATAVCGMMVAVGGFAQDRETMLGVFRTQVEMEKRLLSADVAGLDKVQEQLRGATDRMVRLGDDLLRAEKEGEDLASFLARSADVRKAEAEVDELTRAAQQLRSTLAARRGSLDQLQAEVKRLQEALGGAEDELSGRWDVTIEPGSLSGTFDLRLDGTIVSGVYALSGGWRGSLRGTFISGNLRLERIDSQLGLVAVYTARLITRDDEKRLEGRWESTNLAAGMALLVMFIGLVYLPTMDRECAARRLALKVNTIAGPDDEIFSVGYREPTLAFYARRHVNFSGNWEEIAQPLLEQEHFLCIATETKMALMPADLQDILYEVGHASAYVPSKGTWMSWTFLAPKTPQ